MKKNLIVLFTFIPSPHFLIPSTPYLKKNTLKNIKYDTCLII